MISILKGFLPKTRVSHPISFLLRPLFESRRVKAVFGSLIASTGLLVNLVLFAPNTEPVQALGEIGEMAITTEKVMAAPLPETTGISQGFHAFHPGIDLTAPVGSAIYPIADGVISFVGTLKTGYGRHVIVEHANGLVSLYAHMGKILVEEGQEVTKKMVLGEIGLTGRTTGYHLHLEVRKNGVVVNPLPYL
jgi:murein DD-endopeptidase MepM/ murein hydrolase activator NlpD